MCGIYGSTISYSDDVVTKKLQRISNRGPNFSCFRKYEDRIVLGHNRLAIIDLDPRANQPFEYQHLVVTYNGEIYNFQSIREKLIDKGHAFTTNSDTEVIAAAYLEYGPDCVEEFNGMFSFVVYDRSKDLLFGAVDRLGQKPFYYNLHHGKGFEFGSQISQLNVGNEFNLCERSIESYLLYGYVPSPRSIYQEGRKLPAGHMFKYFLQTNTLEIRQYWDITSNHLVEDSYSQACNKLEALLSDATTIRMVSDVPLGAFLSGGVDSSLVCALAQKNSSRALKTFSVRFSDDMFDESIYAEQIAMHLETSHTTIDCNPARALDMLSKVHTYFDEPFADSSAIPTMLISQETKQYVTVALTGDAGDESFLGYKRYDWINTLARVYKLPKVVRRAISYFLTKSSSYRYQIVGEKLARNANIDQLVYEFLQTMYPAVVSNPVSPDPLYLGYVRNATHHIQKAADLDLKLWLAADGLVKVDRASMAFGLECRSPFLDYRVVEYARSLPVSYRYERGNKKKILKDVLYKYVPKDLLDRPKQGFAIPVDSWLRNDLRNEVFDTLTKDNLLKVPGLNVPFVLANIEKHYKNKLNFGSVIWNLLMYIHWRRNCHV